MSSTKKYFSIIHALGSDSESAGKHRIHPFFVIRGLRFRLETAVAAGGGSNNEPIRNNGKSASTATILSCLVIGLGQMYLGQIMKGVAILLGGIVLSTVTAGILGLPIWIAAMIDAYKIGKRLENGETVGQWQFF